MKKALLFLLFTLSGVIKGTEDDTGSYELVRENPLSSLLGSAVQYTLYKNEGNGFIIFPSESEAILEFSGRHCTVGADSFFQMESYRQLANSNQKFCLNLLSALLGGCIRLPSKKQD